MYEKLSGMTGTADDRRGGVEFSKIYDLEVVVIPTHREMVRADFADLIYARQTGKWNAVIDEIGEEHEAGRPILVGTISVEVSEMLADQLRRRGIKHNVLNAKLHEKEAEIVAQAGRSGAVTIATNMAGRGTDILLGGNPEVMAAESLHKQGTNVPYAAARAVRGGPRRGGADHVRGQGEGAGGRRPAHRRHRTPRVAAHGQLRGRAGRQGDPGSSRFT